MKTEIVGIARTVEQADQICDAYRSTEPWSGAGALIEWKLTERGIEVIAHRDIIVPIN